eukprot:scaffold2992_cov214-Amphora_coffeaeformis.AAC.46
MRVASPLYRAVSLAIAISVLGGVSDAFSVPQSHLAANGAPTFRSIRKGSQRSPPLFYSKHMTVHEDGMPKSQKDELMPCEVKRYGRKNERVMREDGVNADAPDNDPPLHELFSPHQKSGMRPPSKPASAYVHVHEDGMPKDQKDELMPCMVKQHGRINERVMREDGYNNDADPPSKVFGAFRKQNRMGLPTKPAAAYMASHDNGSPRRGNSYLPSGGPPANLIGGAQEKVCPIPESPIQQSVPASAPATQSPGPPPVGMFLQQEAMAPSLPVSAPTSAPAPRSSGPPPVGIFSKHETLDIFGVGNSGQNSASSGQPGPPPVGMFLNQYAESSTSYSQPAASSFSDATGATGYNTGPTFISNNRLVQRLQEIRQKHIPDARSAIIAFNTAFFIYHVLATCFFLMGKKSAVIWPNALTGATAVAGQPLMRDWMFTSRLGNWQPHRYLTAGFLHSGILHLILNLDSVRNIPGQLERKTGSDVYGTVFLLSIVAGHVGQAMWGEAINLTGASGGIAGLYGLYTVSEFLKTKNDRKTQQQIAMSVGKGLGRLFLYGLCLPRMFSNAAHLSGFFAGMASGLVFTLMDPPDGSVAPKRRNTAVMAVWVAAVVALLIQPQWRSAPLLILRSLFQPGSLTTRVRF